MSIQERNKRIRIYLPGIISLIALPMLCIWYFMLHHSFTRQTVMQVAFPDRFEKLPARFDLPHIERFVVINLDNDKEDKIKLDSGQLRVRELILSQDSTWGVKFHFSDYSKYWEFIRVLDICKIERACCFRFDHDDLIVINRPPRPKPANELSPPPLMM